jgi:hypothetical protein
MEAESVTLWRCCACRRGGSALHDSDSPLADVVLAIEDEHYGVAPSCADRNGVALVQVEFRARRHRPLPDRSRPRG